ncbi:NAD binding domain of 6-phosphogluconate dehydrogenase family protein [Janthinobacterium agaricidamnosum NBRC 102515 = DSM 9628]|uniref:NAD binding domain of 6-phosphogluconate dehydrogenase family protein n=1 Tax=Janthinobacterium agaricidamnosum NBRC 102515 = DSM 9628 TaxID=1349767 RepID=W0V3D5_9BURK|nr:NAD binding domain of 6-phosphogluconate dehydrogenase family protein [Janthinobacterium agaricidamnosum NBRC 102515 = DSM 9628]
MTVFNRNPARAEAWLQQYRGRSATTPAAAAEGAEFVFTCIGNDNDLFQVILEQGGLLDGMKPGAVLIDHTTASADAARKIHEAAAQRGIHFLDAPVSGGQAGAENGKLTVMVGGDADAFARAEPVIGVFARAVTLMGPAGAGQLTKMVNQICIAGLVQALSEGLAFAENAGLDAALVVDVISKGASQSWQLENRGKTMIERKFDFGFAVDWMRKDLGICIAEAKRNGSQLPVTELTDQFYSEVQQAGGGRFDTSSLITRLGKK